jgi:hypothetical protein
MRHIAGFLALALCASRASAAGDILYYGGDPRWPGGSACQDNYGSPRATLRTYDNFEAVAPWKVTGFFARLGGNVAPGVDVRRASYEIRTKMGRNDLGELIASGTVPATLTHEGTDRRVRGMEPFNFFRLEVRLPKPLLLPPGVYWLSVVPETNLKEGGQLYLRDSDKGHGVASLRDKASFTVSQFYFHVDTKPTGPTPFAGDFSIGVLGTEVFGPPSAYELATRAPEAPQPAAPEGNPTARDEASLYRSPATNGATRSDERNDDRDVRIVQGARKWPRKKE